MKKPKKTKILIFLLIVIIIIDSFLAFDIFFKDKSVSIKEVIENITEKEDSFDWQYYEDINEDYVGQIVFDSGLINKPVVQATSCYKSDGTPYIFFNKDGSIATDIDNYTGNDVYIWMDFETMEYDYDNKGGSIFMDYRNVLSDQNLIIYGHYFSTLYDKDAERVKAFTPLEKLLDESNYKKNSKVKLILENEIREYELFAVYEFDSSNDIYFEKGQYYRPNYLIDDYVGQYEENYMDEYIEFVNSVKLYDTGISLENGDKTLTLQTCMTPNNNLYEICVFKEINVENR